MSPWTLYTVLFFVALAVVVSVHVLLRRVGAPAGRRVRGERCAECARVVLFEYQAEICETCGAGLHAGCAQDHAIAAHAPRSYRA